MNQKKSVNVTIILPTYNEEDRITKSINKLKSYLQNKQWNCQIIIADGGSKDNTTQVCKKFLQEKYDHIILSHKTRKGKGFSIKEACAHAKGDIIIFTDADFSTPIEEFDSFYELIHSNHFDIVIGSRRLEQKKLAQDQPMYRKFLGKILSLFKKIIFPELKNITDTQCGFKAFNKNVAENIFPQMIIEGGMFDIEFLLRAKQKGYRIKEIQVAWENDESSKINLLWCIINDPIDLLHIRKRINKNLIKS